MCEDLNKYLKDARMDRREARTVDNKKWEDKIASAVRLSLDEKDIAIETMEETIEQLWISNEHLRKKIEKLENAKDGES